MSTKTLLIELGTEELPPKSLKKLSEAFSCSLQKSLSESGLIENNNSSTDLLAAPRRLAFLIGNVLATQPDQDIERKGPSVQAAFKDDGSPTPAVIGFAKSCGVNIEALERRETEKGEWLFFSQTVAGKNIADIVQAALDAAIKSLPIAKRMRWGDKESEFVRPVHWLAAMHGDTVLPVKALGLTANNQTQGHRFHCNETLTISTAEEYIDSLQKQGTVVVDYTKRRNTISTQIDDLASSVGGSIESDPDLLDEVCSLVESPNAILGSIDERFMSVPQESLVSSMRDHQKYFHIVDKDGKLLPHFITVSNIKSSDEARVREGNERVLRARLSDAEFFWETDKKSKLVDHLPALENVTYHAKLGSMAKKVKRLENLAKTIAPQINADSTKSARAAKLAKADLTSNMVGEFSDLQGIMGKYYAQNDGEDPIVATAIEQHYWPKSADSALPETPEAQAVSLTDKLDSLVGIFGAGEIPTGDKDPYALRRAAIGIINILTTGNYDISLEKLISLAAKEYQTQGIEISSEIQHDIANFIQGRYKPYYQNKGYGKSLINAVAASGMDHPVDFAARIVAVDVFEDLAEAKDLAAANKRISNILKKSGNNSLAGDIETSLIEQGAEHDLLQSITELEPSVNALFNDHQYEEGLKHLATLRDPIDAFFDNVMVMAEDEAVKINRLRILQNLQNLFLRVADISVL